MSQPKVSIITPSFNQGKFIEETIKSVLAQNYPNIEHIVMDGGSTDNTLEILKKYSDRIIWKSEPDRGQTHAINKGFKIATGKILAWQNSDDTYMSYTVSTVVDFFQKHPEVSMVYGYFNYIDKDSNLLLTKKMINFDYRKFVCGRFTPSQPTAFFRKEVLKKVGYLNEKFNYSMDREFYCRIGKEFRITLIPRILGNFRIYPQSKSGSKKTKLKWNQEFETIRQTYAPGMLNNLINKYYKYRNRLVYFLKYKHNFKNHFE